MPMFMSTSEQAPTIIHMNTSTTIIHIYLNLIAIIIFVSYITIIYEIIGVIS